MSGIRSASPWEVAYRQGPAFWLTAERYTKQFFALRYKGINVLPVRSTLKAALTDCYVLYLYFHNSRFLLLRYRKCCNAVVVLFEKGTYAPVLRALALNPALVIGSIGSNGQPLPIAGEVQQRDNAMNVKPTDRMLSEMLNNCSTLSPQGHNIDGSLAPGVNLYSRERTYRVYVPKGFDNSKPSALMVVLHGCHQSHDDIQKISGFEALADSKQFLVVYPYVTSYLGYRARQCWGWWVKAHRTRGKGEVADITRVVEQVQKDYCVDASRLYVCGLSSGGAMAVSCLVAYPEVYAGGASVAGLAYGETPAAVKTSGFSIQRYRSLARLCAVMRKNLATVEPPNLLIVHSDSDQVVSVNATDNLEQCWHQVAGLDDENTQTWTLDGETSGAPWSLHGYMDGNRHRLLRLDTTGYPHGWLGGPEGEHSSPAAPNISRLIWWHLNASASRKQNKGEYADNDLLRYAS